MTKDDKKIKKIDRDKLELTDEELEREKWSENATWISSGPEWEKFNAEMKEAAKNTLARLERERTAISVKVPKVTLEKFKKVAESEGLKYQTFLNRLIYLAAEGKLKNL